MKKLYVYIAIINIFGAQIFGAAQSDSSVSLKILDLAIQQYKKKFEQFLQDNQQLSPDEQQKSKEIKEAFKECRVFCIYLKGISGDPQKLCKDSLFLSSGLSEDLYLQTEIETYRQEVIEVEQKINRFLERK